MPVSEGGGVTQEGPDKVKPPKTGGGKGVSRADTPRLYETPSQPKPPAVDNTMPDRVIVSADRTDEIFRNYVTDLDLYHTPDTTTYTAVVKNDVVASAVKSEVLGFFSEVYGADPSQFIAAELLPEPQRTKTYAALAALTQNPVALAVGGGRFPTPPGQAEPEEILQQILSGDRLVEDLTPQEGAAIAPMADELVGALEDLPDQGISSDIKRAIAIGTSRDLSMALTEDDVALLRQLAILRKELPSTGGLTYDTPALADVGIEQIRNLGDGVIVLDIDDAKADPARAFAVKLWLEQNYPELTIQYGREGVWGSLLDKVAMPLDYITAPIGAGFRQLSEVQDRVRTPEEREAFLAKADEIEGYIQAGDRAAYAEAREDLLPMFELAGGVDPEADQTWIQEATRAVAQMRDLGTEEVGWNEFVEQTKENTRPQMIGAGFAESFTKATDTLPGDSWYGASYWGSFLLSAVVFDPLNWGPGLIGGIKAAKVVPKLTRAKYEEVVADSARELMYASATGLVDAAGKPKYGMSWAKAQAEARKGLKGVVDNDFWYPLVGRGWIKNTVYRKLAQTPEEIMTSRPFIRATKRLTHLKEAVGEEQFFSAVTRFFGADFRRGGGSEVAKALSQANGEADMGMTLMRGILGMDNPGVAMDNLVDELADVTRQLDDDARRVLGPDGAPLNALSAEDKAYLIARRHHLSDVIKGREYVRPMTQVLTRKQLRQLERTAGTGYGVYGKALNMGVHLFEKFPGNALNAIPVKDGRDAMIAFENLYKPTGAGEVIALPHVYKRAAAIRAPGGQIIANTVEDSFNHLSNIARLFGLKDSEINRILAGWRELIDSDSAARGYEFLRDTWEQMVDASPRLPSFAKSDLKQMWKGHSSDRSPSWLTMEGVGPKHPSPVVYREIIDPETGFVSHIGRPAIEADQLTVWRTPPIQDLREYLTLTQSTMKRWSKAGWGKRTIAGAHHGVTTAWGHVNSFWRSAILGLRLFGALPARIGLEQQLRMAAYDFNSLVWHPLEWFASTKSGSKGFTELFREHPGAALGVMVQDLTSHPGFAQVKAGREIVDISDGAMYYRAYSERLSRYYASPSYHYWHDPNVGGVALPRVGEEFNPFDLPGGRELSIVRGKGDRATIQGWHAGSDPSLGTGTDFHFGTAESAGARDASPDVNEVAIDIFDGDEIVDTEWVRGSELDARMAEIEAEGFRPVQQDMTEWTPPEVDPVMGENFFRVSVEGRIYGLDNPVRDTGRAEGIDRALAERLRGEGYDAVIYKNAVEGRDQLSVQVLNPSRVRVLPTGSPVDRTLAMMRNGRHADDGAEWLKTYAEYGMDPALAVERTQQEIAQLLGTGEGAELIRTAMRRGEVEIDGELFRVGTTDFANKLQELKESNRWTPGAQFFNRSAGDYLPLQREGAIARFRDNMFATFYSAPDLALSRAPMYRQMAVREFKNLLGRGYSAATAKRLAHARAARGTADMMFTIGAKTSGEYFLKNINPFFPAYRELATTWLKRLPLRVGEGHWALGTAALVRRADIWLSFFRGIGVIQENPDGSLFVPIPGVGHLIAAVTGLDAPFQAKAPVESLFGILPVPARFFDTDEEGKPLPGSEKAKGVFPTLGGFSTFMLGALNQIPGVDLDLMEDWFTLYGADSSLGPLALDRFAEAFGFTLPWMTNLTSEAHQRLRTWAAIDGMRIAYPKMIEEFGRPPDPATPEGVKWAEEWLSRGERYATMTYLVRGLSSMTMPFSLQIEDEGKAEVAQMWDFLNALPRDDSGAFQSAYIRSFLASNPELQAYMVAKTLDTRPADHPDETRDEWEDALKRGDVKVRNAADWAVFALGSNSMFDIQARINSFYDAAETPADFILNFDARAQIDHLQSIRDDYLAFHSADEVNNRIEGQTRAFAEMWEEWEAYESRRDGETTPRLSFEERRVMEIMELEDDIGLYFSPDYDAPQDYYALKERILNRIGYEPRSEIGRAQQWYFNDVQEGYYDELNRLYDKEMPKAETDYERAEVFQKIRDLANRYNKTWVNEANPQWGEFPSPEEYSFMKLPPATQQQQVAEWANLPAYYLTEFQREMAGYDIPEGKQDEASELTKFVSNNEIEFDKAVEKYNIQPSETAYEINRKNYDQAYAAKAKELGLSDYWQSVNSPAYVRVGNALDLGAKTATWGQAVEMVRKATGIITRTPHESSNPPYSPDEYYSASGSSDVAVYQRGRVNDAITQWRRNDAEFDKVIGNLQVWLSREENRALSQQELVDSLFFDVFLI